MYTSQIASYVELGLWVDQKNQVDTYKSFYELTDQIKLILSKYTSRNIDYWATEHAFWNYKGNPNQKQEIKQDVVATKHIEQEKKITLNASFDLEDYIIPKVARLKDIGSNNEKSASSKGSEFEKVVAEVFNLLDFEVEALGQGTGRNPDAIIKYREENTAFIVDAKAYSGGYSLGVDDRAIKEYINHYCPKLIKQGYKRIGFIIVSNSFKSNFDSFINDITWNSDIRRFILLESEALLYLLAYKTKDKHSLSVLIEKLIGFANPITAQ
ncbi:hypothetical protein E1140_09285, partial [Fulvivirga lutimaris]|nr:hypothetical protein [Fulvivirga lutimaris]